MRTNPLIGPLVAVLCLPMALGFATNVSLASTTTPPIGSKQICTNCVVDSTVINKEKSSLDYACGLSTKDASPYAILNGICQRYQCSNGYYYSWSGWSATSNCTDHQIDATPCPEGSCAP